MFSSGIISHLSNVIWNAINIQLLLCFMTSSGISGFRVLRVAIKQIPCAPYGNIIVVTRYKPDGFLNFESAHIAPQHKN